MFVQFWIVVAAGTTSCVSPATSASSPRILPASALVTALVFVAHVCSGAVAAVNTTCLAILLIVAFVVAAAASFPPRIFSVGLRPVLIVIRLLVAAASALPIVALTTATATLSILIIRVLVVVPLLLIALLAPATAASTSLRLLGLILVLVVLVVVAFIHAPVVLVEVLIFALKLAIHPLLVVVSTTSTAACSPLATVAAIAALLLLFVPILVVCAALLLLAVRWIGDTLVDAFLLVPAISSTAATILLSTTFRGTAILVIVHLLFTLALDVVVLSFV